MQRRTVCITAFSVLLGALPGPGMIAQGRAGNSQTRWPRYVVTDLGVVGGAPGQAFHISDNGLISGAAAAADGNESAVLWLSRQNIVLGALQSGGKNSAAFGVNRWAQAVGESDTGVPDPNGEDFCGFAFFGFSSGTECLPVLWEAGFPLALPTLSSANGQRGYNGTTNMINTFGVVVGVAENGLLDPSCPPYDPSKGQTQKFQQRPVFWQDGHVHELPTIAGDPAGVALAVSDSGFMAGGSGTCSAFDPLNFLNIHFAHAIVWDHGTPIDLGNFGGTSGNLAFGVNKYGDAVGFSDTSGDATTLGFLWTKQTRKLTALLPLGSDPISTALGLNDRRTVVGVSVDASFNPRAVIWGDNSYTATDLNTLIPASSGLLLVLACGINSSGQIVGAAVDPATGLFHAYVASPITKDREHELSEPSGPIELPQYVHEMVERRLQLRRSLSPSHAH